MTVRPTLRLAALMAAGIPPFVAIILLAEGLWIIGAAYAVALLALFLFDGMAASRPLDLRTEVDSPSVFHVGREGALLIRIPIARGGLDAVEATCDVTSPLDPAPPVALDRDSDGFRGTVPLRPARRGEARIERLWLRWRGPLGLAEYRSIRELDRAVSVIPDLPAVRRAAIRFPTRDILFGQKAQAQQGEGSEFEALRDYMPGLDHRSIDWKHSARHRNLVCKEFRAERNHHIVLAFDTGHLMAEPLGAVCRLDHAITAGLMVGHMALRVGDRVGLYGFDSRARLFAEPTGGPMAFSSLQGAAARLDYSLDETNFTLGLATLQAHLRRRTLIVLITEFVDTVTAELMLESLGRLGTRHLIVFVTFRDTVLNNLADCRPGDFADVARAVVADEFLRERRAVYERLSRLGVTALETTPDRLGPVLINRYLEIKRQGSI